MELAAREPVTVKTGTVKTETVEIEIVMAITSGVIQVYS
jgi:hypothetical protein